jgi:leader peptidase (prepilin peptidase)/N-methyltransferase
MSDPLFPWLAGLYGLLVGSFLNVCTLRWPLEQSVVRPPSRCPGCGAPIRARDNVPVVGWLLLRGRCRACGEPISVQYPLVELTVGIVWFGAVHAWGLEWEALRGGLFLTLLVGIAVSDARFYIIPDPFSLGGAALGLALAFLPGGIEPVTSALGAVAGFGGFWLVGVLGTWLVRRTRPDRLEQAFAEHDEGRADEELQRRVAHLERRDLRLGLILAALAVGGVAWRVSGLGAGLFATGAGLAGVAILLAWGESFTDPTFAEELAEVEARDAARAEVRQAAGEAPPEPSALGGGDIRMMAMVGAFVGPGGVILTTLLGSLIALVAAVPLSLAFRQLIPLGIFLAYAGAVAWVAGDAILAWYLVFAGLQ